MTQQINSKNKTVLLGIESSGLTCGVGISIDNRLEKELSVNGRNVHSEKLAVFTESLLDDLRIEIADISGIVLSAGPGSFTGLRIGYSLAKGIAHLSKIPIVEVPTLDVWAHQLGKQDIQVLAVIDAYRGEVFYSIYRWQENRFSRITDYSISRIDELSGLITERTLITGAIPADLKSQIGKLSSLAIFESATSRLSMDSLLKLGGQKFVKREFADLNSCEPFYMRKFKGVS